MKKIILTIGFLFGLTATSWATTISDLPTWTWTDATTNKTHKYWVFAGHLTWDQANTIVSGFGDKFYLATITSELEQLSMVGGLDGFSGEYWLGGIQADPNSKASEGWSWANGETFAYTNWKLGEPNDYGSGEHHLGTWSTYGWEWNDEHGNANIAGYIVETIANPEPATMLLFGFGLLGVAGIGRKTLSV